MTVSPVSPRVPLILGDASPPPYRGDAPTHATGVPVPGGRIREGDALWLVLGQTPAGQQRRAVHLSPQRAKDKQTDWQARGWLVALRRIEIDVEQCLHCGSRVIERGRCLDCGRPAT